MKGNMILLAVALSAVLWALIAFVVYVIWIVV